MLAEHVKHGNLHAGLSPREMALARFAVLLTRDPSAVRPESLDSLREHGLSDRDLLDCVEVISYFNYINRVADALGIDHEPEMADAFKRWKKSSTPSE
jgi:uncharacterized peroxidase-related enzyme